MNFSAFFGIGWEHIIDLHAYDHLLFIMTLCAAFRITQWKQILIIVTAFTVGHSATLVLSAFGWVPVNSKVADTLIPLTIMATAFTNIYNYNKEIVKRKINTQYVIALLFGLIHGLAFASNFSFMMPGKGSIVMPLFAFNLGIEAGQIAVVAFFMAALFVYDRYIKGNHFTWNVFISGAGFGIAAIILLNALTQE
jgi:hypothetical protein